MSTANIRSSRRRFLAQAVGAGASLCAFNACSDELATSSGSEPAGPVPVPSDTTVVTLTGTGIPHPAPGRAGSGTLVRWGDIALQFDAGRGTVIRLEEAGASPYSLSAQFVTHVHSDHVVDLVDVAMTRWMPRATMIQ